MYLDNIKQKTSIKYIRIILIIWYFSEWTNITVVKNQEVCYNKNGDEKYIKCVAEFMKLYQKGELKNESFDYWRWKKSLSMALKELLVCEGFLVDTACNGIERYLWYNNSWYNVA